MNRIIRFFITLLFVLTCIMLVGCESTSSGNDNIGSSTSDIPEELSGIMFYKLDVASNYDEVEEKRNYYEKNNGFYIFPLDEDVYVYVSFVFYNPSTEDDFANFVLITPAMNYISMFKLYTTNDTQMPNPQPYSYIDPRTGATIPGYKVEINILAPHGERVEYTYVYKFKSTAVCNNVPMTYSLNSVMKKISQAGKSDKFYFSIISE